MDSTAANELVTVGDIARLLNEPTYRVTYCIDTRSIRPVRRAAGVRLFAASAVAEVRDALVQINAAKRSGYAN